jgi:hypothetical protein
MFHDRQQLDVVEPQSQHVVGEGIGELSPPEAAVGLGVAPRADVDLVDADRPVRSLAFGPAGQPVVVAPAEGEVGDDAGRGRWQLGGRGEGIGPLEPRPVGGLDRELVPVADVSLLQHAGPDARAGLGRQGVHAAPPTVEVADHVDLTGRGGPHGEAPPRGGPPGQGYRTQHLVQAGMGPLVEQPAVVLGDVLDHEGRMSNPNSS